MKIIILLVLLILFFIPTNISADENNQFITIVNPVRISKYTDDPKSSILAQYNEIKKRNLSSTWLLNYDSMIDEGVVATLELFDQTQEKGIFMEITPKLAQAAGVTYNQTDSWHRATSVFLSGYIQSDRIKLIDTVFAEFRKRFRLVPTSVGAWWIDSFSLGYMKNKYGITADLTCADQFATDGYQIWGQYWSTPFYPSNLHAGMPARNKASKLDIVTTQWAARDPINGYGRTVSSAYSTQDYFTLGLTDEYFTKLVNLYAKKGFNEFGQITIGLEGDLSPASYSQNYANQLDIAKNLEVQGIVKVITMKDCSEWYRHQFPSLSPPQVVQTDDLLGKRIKVVLYQSPGYRVGIKYNYDTKQTEIFDLRTYHDNFEEPYNISPNKELNLIINLPSIIDSISYPTERWILFKDEIEKIEGDNKRTILNFRNNRKIILATDSMEVKGVISGYPKSVLESPMIKVNKTANDMIIDPKISWYFPQEGFIFRSLTKEAEFFLQKRKVVMILISLVVIVTGVMFFVYTRKIKNRYKFFLILGILSLAITGGYLWYFGNSRLYFVPQVELDALTRLKLLPGKKIVVYDKFCLQCSWHTQLIPAVFANRRDYVANITGKEVIYNTSVFEAKTRKDGKADLDKLNADYIYAVKFEDYKENIPFSPGDLGIEEIYENANAQIWLIKKNR